MNDEAEVTDLSQGAWSPGHVEDLVRVLVVGRSFVHEADECVGGVEDVHGLFVDLLVGTNESRGTSQRWEAGNSVDSSTRCTHQLLVEIVDGLTAVNGGNCVGGH